MKIAILREAGGLGDVVMTEPVLRGLRTAHPDADIWYVGLPEYAELVANFPQPPDTFLSVERPRRRDRDGAVDPQKWPYLSAIMDADCLIDLFCPAFQHERAHREKTHKSRVECFCEAAGVAPSTPQIEVSTQDHDWARGWLAAQGWWGDEGARLVALAPWSCGVRRTWSQKKWESLAQNLHTAGIGVLVFHAFAAPIRSLVGMHATGLPLPKVAALLSLCDLTVCNDSGLLHLATAVETATLSLWGSTSPQVTLQHYPRARFLFTPQHSTRPAACLAPCYSLFGTCDYEACREGCRILDGITVEEVLANIVG